MRRSTQSGEHGEEVEIAAGESREIAEGTAMDGDDIGEPKR